MQILERAQELERQGQDIVHLEVGEPDFEAPECVRMAAEVAIRTGQTHYTHSMGLLALREAISDYYLTRCGADVSPERILVTTGSSAGLTLLMALLLDPGDEILIPNPGYSPYANFIKAFHGVPGRYTLDPRIGYKCEPRAIAGALKSRTRGVLVNSPANPTGAVQTLETLDEIVRLGVPVISDEIYHGLEYGTRAASLTQVTDRGFVLDGFSKRYAMTGWRIGWLVAPADRVPVLQSLQQNLFISAGSVAQWAALAALQSGGSELLRMRREYGRRRTLLIEGLRRLAFGIAAEPMGAYYILADARHLDGDSLRLAHRILEEARVGVAPGIDFGVEAEGHLRFSFASAYHRIEEALVRLERWLRSLE